MELIHVKHLGWGTEELESRTRTAGPFGCNNFTPSLSLEINLPNSIFKVKQQLFFIVWVVFFPKSWRSHRPPLCTWDPQSLAGEGLGKLPGTVALPLFVQCLPSPFLHASSVWDSVCSSLRIQASPSPAPPALLTQQSHTSSPWSSRSSINHWVGTRLRGRLLL